MNFTKLLRNWFSEGNEELVRPQHLLIDLGDFSCGRSRLGCEVDSSDYFAAALRKRPEFHDSEGGGLDVGVEGGVFDWVFVTLARFRGQFARHGSPINLSTATAEPDILGMFGQPYWTDRSDGEVIMFYEYRRGTVELQFEFSDAISLSIITLARDGVLSKEEQRTAYGVTRSWPPV